MTTNRNRAAKVISKAYRDAFFQLENQMAWAPFAADALDDEGLLAPDLPAPNRQGRWKVTAASFGSVTTSPAGEVVLDAGNFRDMQLYLTPGKALDLARALEAAAAHAQKEETNE